MKSTPEHAAMKQLLIDKRFLQCRLRQVDKQLRELEIRRPGLGRFIKSEIEDFQCDIADCAGSMNIESPCPSPLKRVSVP
jgi:hypothetical protein